MREIIKKDFIAIKNAPLRVEAGKIKEYGTVLLREEGYIWLHQDSCLKIDKLVFESRNPEYDVLAVGEDGEDGGATENGQNGADGGEIKLVISELSDPLKVVTRGGNGGIGGYGGAGGDGGNGQYNGKGGAGGDGGNGGAGGNAGNGPHLVLEYGSAKPVDIQIIHLCAEGGKGGVGGRGGCGGRNGTMRSKALKDRTVVSGHLGESGEPGKPGKSGKLGDKGTHEVMNKKRGAD